MNNLRSILKVTLMIFLIVVVLLVTVFMVGRYGWKLLGFNACESAGIENLEVTDGKVRITGYYPGPFTQGFLGYHAKERDGKLYVGFKFSGLFGIFETGDFDITVSTKSEISEVYIKTSENEYLIWDGGGMFGE